MSRPLLAFWLFAACISVACGGDDSTDDDLSGEQFPPRIESFVASASSVTVGDEVHLTATFDSDHEEVGVITPGDLHVTSGVEVSTGPLDASTEFTLTVTSATGEKVRASIKITVVSAPGITSFEAADGVIRRGEATLLTPVFCDGCTGVIPGIGEVESGVAISTGPLGANRTFTLDVTNVLGTRASSTVSVTVFDGVSCLDVKLARPTAADGAYVLRPSGANVFPVYCDMTTDGGGWTEVLHADTGIYTPTTTAAGDVSVAMGPFAKLSNLDAAVSATDWIFRITGSRSANALYVDTAAPFDDPATALGLLDGGTQRACVAGALAQCDFATTSDDTIDTLAWGMSGDTCDRFVTDAAGSGPACAATSSTTERCFVSGASCGAGGEVQEELAVWVRESYRDAVLRSQPVAYFRLDEASGAIRDEIGGLESVVHDNLSYGAPGLVARDGQTFTANGYAELEYTATLNPPEFSVEMWLDHTGRSGYNRSPITSRDTNRGYFVYVLPNDSITFRVGTGTTYVGVQGPALEPNRRYHVVGTYGGGMLTLYVDGVAVEAPMPADFMPNITRPTRIGAGSTEAAANSGLFYYGHLDEVSIYDHALTAAEVARHHAVGLINAGAQPTP